MTSTNQLTGLTQIEVQAIQIRYLESVMIGILRVFFEFLFFLQKAG